ncbi:MAG: DUF4153 domain-containing protein [Bacteroidota bacterium]|nr:DUF4153 domain-containing protein [Bacteroidota bacterium]
MKFPSVQTLAQITLSTFKRFPLTIIFVLIGCFCSMRLNHTIYVDNDSETHYYYNNILWSAYMGMLLSLNVFIYVERNRLSSAVKWIGGIFTIALVTLFYLSLPDHFSEGRMKQFILFMTGLHLLVAFVPFTARGGVNGFWQYNKSLFLRALTAALYSIVLFIGLSLAMLAVEKLFTVNINYKWYTDLWIYIAEGFSSIFFLAGFPSQFEKLEVNQDYPKGLKIFTQYVLIPIIVVYLVILYAYMIKIAGTHQWPYGWVSYLVLAFAVAGILSLLLIHPIRYEANNKWILAFSRFYYLAICPLIILLFLAIERRINDYGITEERYIVLGLACWLALISLYFIFSKSKNIKTIPISLCLISLLISFGPWGAFSVSFNSQNRRLKQFLQANAMLSGDQKIIPAKKPLHKDDGSQISSIIEYLVNAHGYKSLQPLFSQNLDSMLKSETGKGMNFTYQQSQKLLSFLKLDKIDNDPDNEHYFRIYALTQDSLLALTGYEYFINDYDIANNSGDDSLMNTYLRGSIPLKVLFLKNSGKLSLQSGTDNPVVFDLNAMVSARMKNNFTDDNENGSFHQDSLTLKGENRDLSAKIVIQHLIGMGNTKKIRINSIEAAILVHFKQ